MPRPLQPIAHIGVTVVGEAVAAFDVCNHVEVAGKGFDVVFYAAARDVSLQDRRDVRRPLFVTLVYHVFYVLRFVISPFWRICTRRRNIRLSLPSTSSTCSPRRCARKRPLRPPRRSQGDLLCAS